jgi:hypothetical protein
MHPDVQAQIILSIQEEKRQQAQAHRAEGQLDDSPSWQTRLLSVSGDALIHAGNLLKHYAGSDSVLQSAANNA